MAVFIMVLTKKNDERECESGVCVSVAVTRKRAVKFQVCSGSME